MSEPDSNFIDAMLSVPASDMVNERDAKRYGLPISTMASINKLIHEVTVRTVAVAKKHMAEGNIAMAKKEVETTIQLLGDIKHDLEVLKNENRG